MLVWAAAAVAAPSGYTLSKSTDTCKIYSGPALSNGVVPMMAECTWSDVTLDKIDRIFSKFEDHDLFFSAIAASDVVRSEGGAAIVHQVHQASGISDRECTLKMTRSEVGGGLKFGWTLDAAQPAIDEKRVQVAFDDGYWHFVPRSEGGVTVTYALSYGPGGSVPSFMVRWFQGSGFEAATTELHSWMTGH
ncbi:MAG: hypothetical protein ABMA64_09025 [Myxococcota bacterium]